MPTRRTTLTLLAGLAAARAARPAELPQAEQEVLVAVVNGFPFEAGAKALLVDPSAMLVAAGDGPMAANAAHLRSDQPAATAAVIDDFLRVMAMPADVLIPRRLLRKEARVDVASRERLAAIFDHSGDGWVRFRAAYPDAAGLVRFSRVGFDPASSQALVMMSLASGMTRAAGFLFLMERVDGAWVQRDARPQWGS
jgi:hypothetical protein